MVRVYGTTKPTVGIVSRFYGKERVPDVALREYLLRLQCTTTVPPPIAQQSLTIATSLPDWFTTMLRNDRTLQELWHGRGKPSGTDQTNSGYDYVVARYLASNGITDQDAIASIIAHRPTGHPQRTRKGQPYLLRTVTRALRATPPP